jgi:hypothetical protein
VTHISFFYAACIGTSLDIGHFSFVVFSMKLQVTMLKRVVLILKFMQMHLGNSHLFVHHFTFKVLAFYLPPDCAALCGLISLSASYSISTGEQYIQAEDLYRPSIHWHSMVKELQESEEDHAGCNIQCIFTPQEDIQPTREGIYISQVGIPF